MIFLEDLKGDFDHLAKSKSKKKVFRSPLNFFNVLTFKIL